MTGLSGEKFLEKYDRRSHSGNFISRIQKSGKGIEEMEMGRKVLAVFGMGKGLTYAGTKSNGVSKTTRHQS